MLFPDLSIITVFYSEPLYVDTYFQSILDVYGELPCFFIAGDNGNHKETCERLYHWKSKYPDIILLESFPENLGFAKANNRLASLAKTELVLFLNPDAVLISDCLYPCVKRVIKHNEIVTPVLISKSKPYLFFSPFPHRIFYSFLILLYRCCPSYLITEPDWIQGAFMMMQRRTFLDLGGFDERFFLYTEDLAFCLRAYKRGVSVKILNTLKMEHPSTRMDDLKFELILSQMKTLYNGKIPTPYTVHIFIRSFFSQFGRRQWEILKKVNHS
jgi:GT2 family glycosyltransferase